MTARYLHCGIVLVRSTTDPGDLDLPPDLDFTDPDTVEREGRAWLAKAWAREEVREALTVASPDLGARIGQILAAGQQPGTRDLRRGIMATASYLLRWQRRVTPFGLFAGIIPAAAGPAAARIGTAHRVVARADADWITALAQALEQNPAVRQHLTVVADNTGIVRDGRLIVARRAGPGSRAAGQACEASVRWTRPVQAAMEMAGSPVGFAELAARLAARFPAVAPDRVRALLDV